jgi:protein SCO1/2
MSTNFEELQTAIKDSSGALANTRLLSITLDPGFDTPEVLKTYAGYHHSDPQIWSFATGDEKEIDALTRAFSVYRRTERGTISHGLTTALIDKDGKIAKLWRGNAWKPDEVIEEINKHGG